MSFARDVYTAGAAATDFTISFAYQDETHVLVYLDGVLQTNGATDDYTIVSTTTVRFNSGLTGGETVVIQRATSQSTRLVDYTAGALSEADLDNDSIQAFYMAQESIDIAGTALRRGTDNLFTAESERITNVADATSGQDAVTKTQLDAVVATAGNVPTPDNPGDDGNVLSASAGTFDWSTLLSLGAAELTAANAFSGANTFSGINTFSAANSHTGAETFTGPVILTKGSDIASASGITIPTDGSYFDVTGTTAITGMTVAAGRFFMLQFDGALVLTNGASLILDGADDILTAAGDRAIFYAEASNTVRCVGYTKVSGQAVKPPSMRGVLWGLNVTNNGTDAAKDLDIAAGACMADDGSDIIELSSALVKQLDASWAVGTAAGALDGSESVAGTPDASTWYHIWAIKRSDTGVVDILASESATSPTMPSNYDKKCLIWSVLFDATPDILPFDAYLDLCTWITPINNYDADPGATEITTTVSTPLGIRTLAKLAITAYMTADGAVQLAVYPVGGSATAANNAGAQVQLSSNVSDSSDDDAGSSEVHVVTDTSSQVNHIADTNVSAMQVTTLGFIHPRGRS